MMDKDQSRSNITPADRVGEIGDTGLPTGVDPGTTDLGDDVYRDATNQGSGLPSDNSGTLEGGLDPRTTDLGDDVTRSASGC